MSFNFSLDLQKIDPRAESLLNQADVLMQNRNYIEAAKLYQQSINIQNHEESHYKLGICYELAGNKDAALKSYRKCIMMNAYHLGALENAGDIYTASGQGLLAIESYGMAIMAHPEHSILKEKLVGILSFQVFKAMGEPLRNIVLECMKDPKTDLSYMALGWLSICETIPAFQTVYKTAQYVTYDDFRKNFAALPSYKGLYEDFFITGLARIFAPDKKFERFLTHLRRYCLTTPEFWQNNESLLLFVSALSHYTFHIEYVFAVEDSEMEMVRAIEHKCATGSATRDDLLILACYQPLGKLEGIKDAIKPYKDDPYLSSVIERQLKQEEALIELRQVIPSISTIEDEISRKVQNQYEQSPYPRWSGFNKTIKPIEEELWGKKAEILIAGCGTGLEAIELAYCFPDAQILAVDLSRSSIAYGIMKAKEYDIQNITFKQCDILNLGILEKKFDLVTSSGVLHHMKEPMAGWKVISELVKPGGLMRIALYSSKARQSINTARKIISEQGLHPDLDTIRTFRGNSKNILNRHDYESISAMRDFYTTSECRDLLFHVQEHQFDIQQIATCLDELGLKFLQFYLPHKKIARYHNRFKDDPAANNLENWDAFEKTYPDTFIEMYKFWCRK